MKRFHIEAWGHTTAPDLDYETDDDDRAWLMWHYPCVSVTLQTPVPHNALNALIKQNA